MRLREIVGVGSVALALAACDTSAVSPESVPARLALQPTALSLSIESAVSIGFRLLSASGDTLDAKSDRFTFVSRDPAIVHVDSAGVVRSALAMGRTWIVATVVARGRTIVDSLPVIVVCNASGGIEVLPPSSTIRVGEQFTARLRFLICDHRLERPDTVTWSSRDSAIASVDAASGLVTGRSPGVVTILGVGRHGAPPAGPIVTVIP